MGADTRGLSKACRGGLGSGFIHIPNGDARTAACGKRRHRKPNAARRPCYHRNSA
jgi:hypothetical protein